MNYEMQQITREPEATNITAAQQQNRMGIYKFASFMIEFALIASVAYFGVFYVSKIKNENNDKESNSSHNTTAVNSLSEHYFGKATVIITDFKDIHFESNISSVIVSVQHNASHIIKFDRLNNNEFVTPDAVYASNQLIIDILESDSSLKPIHVILPFNDILVFGFSDRKTILISCGRYSFGVKVKWQELSQ